MKTVMSPLSRSGTLSTTLATFLLFLPSSSMALDEEKRPTAIPSASAPEMLKRFVTECVLVTPGENGFPKKAVIGKATPMPHEVARQEIELEHRFRISKYEMTQELYQLVAGRNPSRWKGPRNSVETVSWQQAQQFCAELTRDLHARNLIEPQEEVRLPTAVEWEYCCRAGATTDFCFGDISHDEGDTSVLDEFAWHTGNAAGNDPAVGVLKPNAWDLYDVHGYLWEYVADTAPNGATKERMIRGGSWRDSYPLLSSSTYLTVPDHVGSDAIGFRCVIAAKPEAKNATGR